MKYIRPTKYNKLNWKSLKCQNIYLMHDQIYKRIVLSDYKNYNFKLSISDKKVIRTNDISRLMKIFYIGRNGIIKNALVDEYYNFFSYMYRLKRLKK